MSRLLNKTVTVLLIVTLLSANLAGTAFGIISYATNEEKQNIINSEEIKIEDEKNALKIETSKLFKNNMQETETEYEEKLEIKVDEGKQFNQIKIDDVNTEISSGEEKVDTEDEQEKIGIFYKSTRINKLELMNSIGDKGRLEIKYQSIEDNKENIIPEEDETILPEETEKEEIEKEETEKGIINAENEIVQIDVNTETDEEGYITIIYPEKTFLVKLNFETETNKVEKIEILHTKIVEKVTEIEKVNVLETTKNIIVKGEEEILNEQESFSMPINYTKTVAELGIDKTKLSTSTENKINFTITMHTNELKYDLYKNPYFIIELPEQIKTINIDNTIILNNQYFEVSSVETGTLENGNKGIAIKLNGEQTEHTKSNEENIQILMETTITTNELIPTVESEVNLHYINENAKTYDGIGTQNTGISNVEVSLISNKEIIVETKATVGQETTTSFKDNYSTIIVSPHTHNMASVNGTVINNLGEDIQNAKIIGTVSNIGEITGIQNVYYTENENATADINDIRNGWTAEYLQTAKKFLIIIEDFKQAETVSFGYNIYMPETVEEDTVYELSYDVYNTNNQLLKTSKITIYQEAERFDYYEDEMIKANIIIENVRNLEVGETIKYKINILNVSGQDLKNINMCIPTSEAIGKVYGNAKGGYIHKSGNQINIAKLDIANGELLTIEVNAEIDKYIAPSEKIAVTINYQNKQAEISSRAKITEPSIIQTTITSDKLGRKLEKDENITYKITLKNNGKSYSHVDVSLPEVAGMNIQKIESVNKATGKKKTLTAVKLDGKLNNVEINPGEVVEILVQCTANELDADVKGIIYANITGPDIYDTVTDKLSNIVSKTEKVVEENNTNNNEQQNTINKEEDIDNTVSGIAWLDKNENGQKDKNETTLKGIQAILVDAQNSKEIARTTTNSKGEYTFNNISKGTYVVLFNYNTNNFTVTDYKNEEADSTFVSDVISTTQGSTTVAKTEVMKLEQGKTENVNIGLVLNKKFDMSINKEITKVTVNNEIGTNTYEFNNTNLAKIEIQGKYLKGSLIIVEYDIKITNVGEVAGYAKLISDKIPEGMKFTSELNTSWYEGNNGEIYCAALADKEIQPGQTESIKLILTKEMKDDKVVSPVNSVTLEETFNEYLIDDKKQENNSAEATIIISLTTGNVKSYIWLVLVVIAIIGTGAFGATKIISRDFMEVVDEERRK